MPLDLSQVGQIVSTLDAGLSVGTCLPLNWPVANTILYMPLRLTAPFHLHKLFIYNGVTVSGNVDVGLYTIDGARLVSSGSVAQSPVSSIQEFGSWNILLPPAIYYFAMVMDNNVGYTLKLGSATSRSRAIGCLEQAATFPLPATATFAVGTGAFYPLVGAAERVLL